MKKLLLLAVVLVFLVPTVFAAIDNVEVIFGANTSITTAGPLTRMDVRLEVSGTTSATNTFELYGDLTELNKDEVQTLNLLNKAFICQLNTNESTFFCTTNLQLRPTGPQPLLKFRLIENGTETSQDYTHSFTWDTTPPQVVSMSTEYSYDGFPVMKNKQFNEFTFTLQDQVGSFEVLRNVWFAIGNNPRDHAGTCSGMTCSGISTKSCTPGAIADVLLVHPSTDDAGNAFSLSKEFDVLCDGRAPQLITPPESAVSVTLLDVDDYYTVPKTGDTILISLVVEEDATGINAQANFSGLLDTSNLVDGTCVLSEEQPQRLFNCTWTLADINDGTHDITFSIYDTVGNQLRIDDKPANIVYELIVDEFVLAEEETPLFFRPVTGKSPATQGYNRVAIDLALENGLEYPIFATFTPERSSVAGDVQTLYTQTDPYECVLLNTRGTSVSARKVFSDIRIAKPDLNYDSQGGNRIDFTFTALDINSVPNDMLVMCNVTAIVRANGKTYQNPTHYTVTMPLKFKNTALGGEHIGSKYAEQIKTREERINGTLSQAIVIMNKAGATLSSICDMYTALGTLDTSGAAMKAIAVAGNAALPQFAGLWQGVNSGGQAIQTPSQKLKNEIMQEEMKSNLIKIIENSCKWVSCSMDKNANALQLKGQGEWYFDGNTNIEKALSFSNGDKSATGGQGILNDLSDDLTKGITIPNPKESIVSSVMTQCWPGVVYHVNRYREASCETLLCMKEMSLRGMDASVCQQAQAQFICQEIVGEAFEAIPFTRAAENLVENVQSMARNILPNTLKYVSNNIICKDYVVEAPPVETIYDQVKVFTCNLPKAIGGVINANTNRNGNAGSFVYPDTEDICAQALCNDPNGCETKYASLLHNFNPVQGLAQNQLITGTALDTKRVPQDPDEARSIVEREERGLEKLRIKQTELQKQYETAQANYDANYASRQMRTQDAWEEYMGAPIDNKEDALNDYLKAKKAQDDLLLELTNAKTAVDNYQKYHVQAQQDEVNLARENLERALSGLPPLEKYEVYQQELKNYEQMLVDIKNKERDGTAANEVTIGAEELAAKEQAQALLNGQGFDPGTPDPAQVVTSVGLDPARWTIKENKQGIREIVPTGAYTNELQQYQTQLDRYNQGVQLYTIHKDAIDSLSVSDLASAYSVYYPNSAVTAQSIKENPGELFVVKKELLDKNLEYAGYPDIVDETTPWNSPIGMSPEFVAQGKAATAEIAQLEQEQELAKRKELPVDIQPRTLDDVENLFPELGVQGIVQPDYVFINGEIVPTQKKQNEIDARRDYLLKQGYSLDEIKNMEAFAARIAARSHEISKDSRERLQRNTDLLKTTNEEIDELERLISACEVEGMSCPELETYESELYKAQLTATELENEIKTDTKVITTADAKALQEDVAKQEARKQLANKIERYATGTATILWNAGLLDWMVSTNWGRDGNPYNQFIDGALNTDQWKARICGPLTNTRKQGAIGDTGTVLQCQGSTCTPVLSQAAERLNISETEYLYTTVFVVGPYQGTDEYTYQVYLVERNGNKRALFDSELTVSSGRADTTERSFVSQREYQEICIQFIEGVYPPGELNAQREYCKPIVDAAQGASAFDTGTPISNAQASAGGYSSATLNNAGINNEI